MTTKISEGEKAARIHADDRCPGMDDCDIVYSMRANDFLAGVKWVLLQAEINAKGIRGKPEKSVVLTSRLRKLLEPK